ncbi:hypothetical protein MP228_005429 [Amoeboaphelidium protococcarum]|nr:hypothetical protein MP228_005429 [Amoeboaphelidium protococcarum]
MNKNELQTLNDFTFDEKELENGLDSMQQIVDDHPTNESIGNGDGYTEFNLDDIHVDVSQYESLNKLADNEDDELDKQFEQLRKSLNAVTSPHILDAIPERSSLPSETSQFDQQYSNHHNNNHHHQNYERSLQLNDITFPRIGVQFDHHDGEQSVVQQNQQSLFDLQLQVQQLQAENQKINAENANLNSKLYSLQDKYDALQQDRRAQMASEVEVKILQVEQHLRNENERQLKLLKSEYEGVIDRLQLQIDSKDQQLLRQSLREQKSQSTSISQYTQTDDQTYMKLQSEVVIKADRIFTLEDQVRQLTSRNEALSNDLLSVRIQHEESLQQLSSLRAMLELKDVQILEINTELHQTKRDGSESIQRIKSKCTQAYEDAVDQLKAEYKRVIDTLKQKIEYEKKHRVRYQQQASDLAKVHQQLQNVQQDLSHIRQQHQSEINTLLEQHESEIKTLKQKYLQTLTKMREDAAVMKARTEERYMRELQEANRKHSVDHKRFTMSERIPQKIIRM